MTQPNQSTCSPWATSADVCSPCDDYAFDPVLLDDSLQFASDTLFLLTGSRWPGVCEETVRPCAQRRSYDSGPPSRRQSDRDRGWSAGSWGGRPWGFCSCNRESACGCTSLPSIKLGGSPIVSILEVKIDGAVLDPSEYRVDDYDKLIRLPASDGTWDGWPCCQRLELGDDEEHTFSVRYEFGADPPVGGRISAASLGCQFALACQPETVGTCRLPKRITSITRQGITIAVLDPLSLFKDGLTGLAEVDMWVQSILLGDKRRPAMFGNPDAMMRRVRRVDT